MKKVEHLRARGAQKSVTGVTSNPDFAERGLGQEPQALGTFRVARVVDEGNEEERKKSYTATRTECYPLPPNPPKFSRGCAACIWSCVYCVAWALFSTPKSALDMASDPIISKRLIISGLNTSFDENTLALRLSNFGKVHSFTGLGALDANGECCNSSDSTGFPILL